MLAISLHSVFEGIAMGLRTKASIVWYLCFAIAVHKFIIAFCIGLQVKKCDNYLPLEKYLAKNHDFFSEPKNSLYHPELVP